MAGRTGQGALFLGGRRAAQQGWLTRTERAVQGALGLFLLLAVALGIHFQLSGTARALSFAALALAATAFVALWVTRSRRSAWSLLVAVALVAGAWWSTIQPSASRDWAPEVAYGVTAAIGPDTVTLANIRNFDWRSEADFTPRWETRTYDLDRIASVDVLTSVWSNPSIAHTLVSFGFSDGQHVVFSAEIRKEKGEAYSSIGGFFKEYELVLIAADERDIVRLRTDVRRETVSLFPLNASPAEARALFLSYLALGNELAARPRFYNTLTANCTTVVWRLVRALSPDFPADWRVVLSGHLPRFLHDLGRVRTDRSAEDMVALARLKPLGPADPDGADFSRRLRASVLP